MEIDKFIIRNLALGSIRMSAAKKTKPSSAVAANAPAAARGSTITIPSITIPTLSSMFAPAPVNTANTSHPSNCNCGCCCQTSTTVCLTFDTTLLQSLVNMFPKIRITNNNTCSDPDCDCDEEP